MPVRTLTSAQTRRLWWPLWGMLGVASCGPRVEHTPAAGGGLREHAGGSPHTATCPERLPAPNALPNTFPELERLEYWLGRSTPSELEEPLLSVQNLEPHDTALRQGIETLRMVDLTHAPSLQEIQDALATRLAALSARFESGEFVAEQHTERYAAQLKQDPRTLFREARSLHVALEPVDLSCMPFDAVVRSTTGNPRFDRNRCSRARAQEPIEVLGYYGSTWRIARTRYSWGFIPQDAVLSPPVPAHLAEMYRGGRELLLRQPLAAGSRTLLPDTLLPWFVLEEGEKTLGSPRTQVAGAGGSGPGGLQGTQSWIARDDGFFAVQLSAEQAMPAARALTRRAFLEQAFTYIGSPYGWGDQDGGRDCSRFVVDVLARFGLHVPRTSGEQSRAGLYSVEVPPEASEVERLGVLDAAHERGVVLVHFPGHIMIYLGRDHQGVPRALHSFAEYLEPCEGGGETLYEVGRVSVTDFSLGQGSSRRSFLERITRLSVLGKAPGHALLALSRFRPALPPSKPEPDVCRESRETALFASPRAPHAGAPLRVIAVTREESRPANLWLVNPKGEVVAPPVHELGVGPYGRWVELPSPQPGRWTALLADGDRVLACEHIRVARALTRQAAPRTPDEPAWHARTAWDEDTENLYAAFIEQLFSQPEEELGTWPSLTPVLRDARYNLLFNHLGLEEDTRLSLTPDCADLPYFLRAYFAWKMGLPFGYRQCSRGRAGAAPRCGALLTHEQAVPGEDAVAAFEYFVKRQVGAGVHSASGRTLPDDEESDFYPLPLTRTALRPGTVFADPYGHVIVLAKWIPQGLAGSGILIGADAQPDATVGRRRFWRGNFLFTPDTSDVGAGFKTFRPIVKGEKGYEALGGRALVGHEHYPEPSLQQYQGSHDDFYARMDELIYPRAVSLRERLQQRVAALFEQVERRVEAIDVGEAGVPKQARPVAMPEGYAVFETHGYWEDFATPSRDMRLLIAIDAVRALPEDVRARPERYGVTREAAREAQEETERALRAALEERRFRYTRSDGSPFELTLADVLTRSEALELGYNPNDCPEVRWGAPEGSAELSTCTRRAPAAQRALMASYRDWFRARARPPRP